MLRALRTGDEWLGHDLQLTMAELRVLHYLPTHLSLQEIADELHITRNTAKSHVVAIYRKLGTETRSDAVARGPRDRNADRGTTDLARSAWMSQRKRR